MLEHIKAVSLDLDDTLWDIHSVISRAEQLLHDWLARHYPRITAAYSVTAMREVRASINRAHPELAHDLSELRRRSLRWHARQAGYPAEDVERGFDVYFAARNQVELFDDVTPALAALAGRYPLVALTNGNADLGVIGLARYFDAAITAAQVQACKPDPAMFAAAARSAGCRNEEVLHVGDDPLSDVHGARAAGAVAVWINRRGLLWPAQQPAPEHQISDLGGLLELLGVPAHAA